MSKYSRNHVTNAVLERNLRSRVAKNRIDTADMLADMAEVDARKLYVPAGFPSMYFYCVEGLEMSADSAYKRIRAARAARRFPDIFDAIADGRLHLSAVVMLAPHLTENTADELLKAAAKRKTKAEIDAILAKRFPKPDVPALIQPITASTLPAALTPQLAPGPVPELTFRPVETIEPLVAAKVEVTRAK